MVVNGIDIEIEYKNIKHIHLSVYPPNGRVHVSAPYETSEKHLRFFVLSRWIWIIEKRKEAMTHNIQPKRDFVSGECHYYKGQAYRLRVDHEPNERQKVFIEGDYLVVRCRNRENVEDLLKEWYRERLKETCPALVEEWVKKINVSMPAVEFLSMPLRWGSCNQKKQKIIFNLELAKKPQECIEYVVAHEVLHLVEHNHTPRFFRLLQTNLPNWESLQNQLNELAF
ncbi:MAG: M48 family metallopeptidase [Fibrobacteraceae bacterium]|nr:M48 family metallopeptidase [Fibrobacteraceae bacterium]